MVATGWLRAAGTFLALSGVASACQDARCKPVERCNVRAADCQRAALAHAACLSGRDVPEAFSVEVRAVTRDELLEERLSELEDREPDAQAEAVSRGLVLMELRDAEATAEERTRDSTARVGGFYSSDDRRITVVGDPPFTDGRYLVVLVHEMVHALQDAAGHLDHESATYDQSWAHSAMVEGEATLASDEAFIEGYGLRFDEARYARALASYRQGGGWWWRFPSDQDIFGLVGSAFVYPYGASYLWPIKREREPAAIAAVFDDPPVSTHAVMNLNPSRPGERPNSLGEDAVPVLAGATLLGSYHLGRFAYRSWAARDSRSMFARDLPSHQAFVADTLSIFSVDETSQVLAAWRFRFDGEELVEAFLARLEAEEAYRELRGEAEAGEMAAENVRLGSGGADLWIFAAEDAETLALVPDAPQWAAAPDEDGFVELDEDPESREIACPRPGLVWQLPEL